MENTIYLPIILIGLLYIFFIMLTLFIFGFIKRQYEILKLQIKLELVEELIKVKKEKAKK